MAWGLVFLMQRQSSGCSLYSKANSSDISGSCRAAAFTCFVKHSATSDQEQGETELSLLLSDGYTEPSSVREREREKVDVERGKRSRGEVRPSTAQERMATIRCINYTAWRRWVTLECGRLTPSNTSRSGASSCYHC